MTRGRRGRRASIAITIGVSAGTLSGVFGVGGGVVVIPALMLLLAFDQRRAAGTSLAAIVPTAAVGVVSYATHGWVAWGPAILLAAGAIIGAQLGIRMLPRVPLLALRWVFITFASGAIVTLFLVVPVRAEQVPITGWLGLELVALGLITGVLSGLLGVGGGIVVVPALMVLFGFDDLISKGTSLLMMIPAALAGTVGNLRRSQVDLPLAITVGASACATVPLGTWVAASIDPRTANIVFAIFVAIIVVQMALARPQSPPPQVGRDPRPAG